MKINKIGRHFSVSEFHSHYSYAQTQFRTCALVSGTRVAFKLWNILAFKYMEYDILYFVNYLSNLWFTTLNFFAFDLKWKGFFLFLACMKCQHQQIYNVSSNSVMKQERETIYISHTHTHTPFDHLHVLMLLLPLLLCTRIILTYVIVILIEGAPYV